jgi:bifunctional UDP-N-acetylglucosamine pyrophosphorylase/glucosamine-1-phosphate N-acetyltransferase
VTQDINILIMAAGLGTRMKSNRAKVLHELDGRPLVNHVVEAALALDPKSVCVIVGHQADDVKAAVTAEFPATEFVIQLKQLGTGDAVSAARDLFANVDGTLMVLSGDVPMLSAETLRRLIDAHIGANAACTVLTIDLDDPTGYGRVICDGGRLTKIVEEKDASDQEKACTTINSGIYCFDAKKLYLALAEVGNQNAQGEYYLTDVPAILNARGETVATFSCDDASQVEGVNDRRQLAAMEQELRTRTVRR